MNTTSESPQDLEQITRDASEKSILNVLEKVSGGSYEDMTQWLDQNGIDYMGWALGTDLETPLFLRHICICDTTGNYRKEFFSRFGEGTLTKWNDTHFREYTAEYRLGTHNLGDFNGSLRFIDGLVVERIGVDFFDHVDEHGRSYNGDKPLANI